MLICWEKKSLPIWCRQTFNNSPLTSLVSFLFVMICFSHCHFHFVWVAVHAAQGPRCIKNSGAVRAWAVCLLLRTAEPITCRLFSTPTQLWLRCLLTVSLNNLLLLFLYCNCCCSTKVSFYLLLGNNIY